MSAQTPEHTEQLAAINQQVVAEGELLPAVRLRDGSTVQTGTVATMLVNIDRYNNGERGAVEEELTLAIPTLIKIGLFDLFSPDEWLQGDNPGRRLLGGKAKAWLATNAGRP